MANNIQLNEGADGDKLSAKDIGSDVKVQNIILKKADGTTDVVQQTDALTDTELRATAVPVSAAALPLPTGAAIAASQQTDGLTDTELRATAVPVSAASLPLPSGAATAANQQTDALTDTELRATAVPVSAASLPLPSGAATAANQQTDALTDTELRATAVPVSQADNLISTANSRAASTLAAGAVFQGTVEDVTHYGRAGIAIHSTNSTDGVLTIEVSHDNVTWSGPPREWSDTSIATPHMWNIVEKYFRIKYTNGTTEATALSIQVQYSKNASIVLGHELNAILPAETEAQAMRPTNSFDLDTAREHILGQRAFFFFGFNDDIDTAWEDVHASGGDIQWQTTAAKVKVASSDAIDNSSGNGLRSVEIHGLSATGVDQDEVIVLNGTTAVESSLTYIRINKMHSEAVGTYGGSHQGNIECRVTNATFANGAILATMKGVEGNVDTSVQYGRGEAGNGFWSVPLGKVMYITRLGVAMSLAGNNNTLDIALFERDGLLTVAAPFEPRRVLWEVAEIEQPHTKTFKSHIKIKALTDVWFRARGSTTGNKVETSLDFYLLDEDASGA